MTLNGSIKQNDMMSGGDTKGGATGSVTRTALDSAPYVTPSGEQNLSAEEKQPYGVGSMIMMILLMRKRSELLLI